MAENTPTPNYNFNLPLVGGDDNAWGDLLNANWSSIDAILWSVSGVASAALTPALGDARYLRLSGGTITGAVTMPILVAPQISGTSGGAPPSLINGPNPGDNSQTVPTTAWVNQAVEAAIGAIPVPPAPSNADPLVNGTAAPGSSALYSRGDHVHPTDATRLAVAGGTMTGALNGTSASFSTITAASDVIDGAAGALRVLSYQTSGTARWAIQTNAIAESGANAGSNFEIQRFSDAGAYIDTPLSINRATGGLTAPAATFLGSVTGPNITLNGATVPQLSVTTSAASAELRLDAPATYPKFVRGCVGGLSRWAIQFGDGSPETGANAGTNFAIARYSDAGALIDYPFQIVRQSSVAVFSLGTANQIIVRGSTQPGMTVQNAAGTTSYGQFYTLPTSGQIGIYHQAANSSAFLNGSGQLQTNTFYNATATAFMAGGTLWTNTSDDRIKTVQGPYDMGLDEVVKLNPVVFTYKGNDTPTEQLDSPPFNPDPSNSDEDIAPRAMIERAPYPASMHYQLAVDQTQVVGFVAQELEQIFPGMVTARPGYIDGEPVTDLRDVNLSNLIYALVNSVKTLAARVEALERGKA